jgi:hypothetical protein
MAKPEKAKSGERWQLRADYIETCNCDFGCPCNFSGYPTGGFCEAFDTYHIREGRFGRTRLDGLDVVWALSWPNAIHKGNGTMRLYISEEATPEQRDALVRIFTGKAGGNGPFTVFAATMSTIEEPVFTKIEMHVDGRRTHYRIPGVVEVALAPHTNPVSGEVQDVRLTLPKGFIFRTGQGAKSLVMKLLGMGRLSFDHSGKNAWYARVEYAGP